MKHFKYEGMTSSGVKIDGVIEAFDKTEAVNKAKESCYVVSSVKEVSAQGTNIFNTDISVLLNSKIQDKDLSLLCSQLAIELKAGLAIVKALQLIAENEKNPVMKNILTQVADDVHAGHTLSESFAERGPQLPTTFIETIRAGEESGRLEDSFIRLKKYYESQAGVKSAVKSALIYPILLLVVAVVVVGIIMIFAVPVFKESFGETGLPGVTKALIAVSDFMVNYWYMFLIFIALIAVAIKLIGRTDKGRAFFDTIALTFPGIGAVNIMSTAANFCATMSTMLASGLTLVQSLAITANVNDNVLINNDINSMKNGVIEGKKLADGMEKSPWFPQLLKEMTTVGEETGNLEETLDVVNEYYNTEVNVAVKNALGILEPAIILVLAGLVVFILLAVYLPLFGMYGDIG